jgi:hypothetical protein
MRIHIICSNCQSSVWEIVLIDGERLSIKCFMCSAREDIKPGPVKLVVG